MPRSRIARVVVVAWCMLATSDCASMRTLVDYQPGDPIFMSGARFDVAVISNDPIALQRFHSHPVDWPWVYLPFSFVADLFFWLLPRSLDLLSKLPGGGPSQ